MTAATHDHSFRPHILVDAIIQTMDRMHALDISGYDPSFLDRTIDKRLQATGCRTREIYLSDHLQTHTPEAMALHRSLRVGYSAFFRDSLTFALLENQVLPDLVENARKTGRNRFQQQCLQFSAFPNLLYLRVLPQIAKRVNSDFLTDFSIPQVAEKHG